jgi:hypothetical protein
MTALRWVWIGVLLAGCMMMTHSTSGPTPTPAASGGGQQAASTPKQARVVSEGSGSHVVAGYNLIERELDKAKDGSDEAAWHALAAKKAAAKTKQFVTDAKQKGSWADGLRYETANDGTMSEEDMLAKLDDLAKRADAAWDQAKPAAHKAWKKMYGASSSDALDKLEELGKPARIEKKKKNTCWYFENDDGKQMWCWTKAGKLAEHKVEQPVETAAADSGGGDAAPEKKSGSYKKVSIFNGQANCAGGSWAQGNAVIKDSDGAYKECSLTNGQCGAAGSWYQGKAVVQDDDGSYKECEIFNGQPNCAGQSWYQGDAVIWCDD